MRKLLITNILTIIWWTGSAQPSYSNEKVLGFYQSLQPEAALAYLLKTPENNRFQYRFDLAYAYFVNKQYKPAYNIFQRLDREDPTVALVTNYLGILNQLFGKYDSALYYYKRLTQLSPQNYQAWQNAANLWLKMNAYDSAFWYIQKSYQLNPRNASVILDYATELVRIKKNKQAEAIIDSFLVPFPDNEEVISRKISYCMENSRYPEVIKWAERLRAETAPTPMAYINLAFAYLNMAQPDSVLALRDWVRGLGMDNESQVYASALAWTLKSNFTRSNLLLDSCITQSLGSNAPLYFRAKAENFTQLKNYSKAVSEYDSAYYIFKDPIDLYHSGKIYDADLGNRKKAADYYKKYLRVQHQGSRPEENAVRKYISNFLQQNKNAL